MTENEFLLADRLQKIRQVIGQYGEENFYASFSGGRDSTVLHYLIDEAIPGNSIPRVYADTGIEFNAVREFVLDLQKHDDRIVVIKPVTPIKPTLERVGYPFKSKSHSEILERYQRSGKTTSVKQYLGERDDKAPWSPQKSCPQKLRYQFTDGFTLKISDKCCEEMKEKPIDRWAKDNARPYSITGLMRDEGGRRFNAVCLAFRANKLRRFNPMAPLTKTWEDWYIQERGIKMCRLYYEPFSFPRTGCKGCPFAVKLQQELDLLQKYLPAERRQCELIWGPVYEEYRRIGYRLKKSAPKYEAKQMTIFDYIGDETDAHIDHSDRDPAPAGADLSIFRGGYE